MVELVRVQQHYTSHCWPARSNKLEVSCNALSLRKMKTHIFALKSARACPMPSDTTHYSPNAYNVSVQVLRLHGLLKVIGASTKECSRVEEHTFLPPLPNSIASSGWSQSDKHTVKHRPPNSSTSHVKRSQSKALLFCFFVFFRDWEAKKDSRLRWIVLLESPLQVTSLNPPFNCKLPDHHTKPGRGRSICCRTECQSFSA